MVRSVAPLIADILDRIDKIQSATRDRSFQDFERDWVLRFAIERGIENISEAVRHLPDELLETQSSIPWPMIRGIGNVLRHEYHRTAPKIIWGVVTRHLMPLRNAIAAIQAEAADFQLTSSDSAKKLEEV